MKYINQSFQNKIEEIVGLYPHFKVVEKSDEHIAHEILESQGMQLLENLRLTYSRKPDLWKSFSDSNQRALVFYEKDLHTTIAAFSEGEIYYNQKRTENYYSSDLRLTPKATMRIRKDFREVYQKFIAALPEDSICTTAILKDNLKAMNAFTRGSVGLFYNQMFEYFIRTIVILPTIVFNKSPGIKGHKIVLLKDHAEKLDELKLFLKNYQESAVFSNDLIRSREVKTEAREFLILKDDVISGYFSLLRPTSRSIYVQTTSIWIKILLKIMSIFSRTDLSVKLPWVYLTSIVLSQELKDRPNILSNIILSLRRFKALKTGELLLLLHPKSENFGKESLESSFMLKCPQIVNTGVIFRVETAKHDRSLHGSIHLDPSEI